MAEPMIFHEKEEFLEALRRLVREGVAKERIRVITPFSVTEVEEILPRMPSQVKVFALAGAASGTVAGFAFTILTTLSWPLIVGGKPIVSIPPFIIIAFAPRSCSGPFPPSWVSSSCRGFRASGASGRWRNTGMHS
ncbi:MAG: quinol:electron acceptor oxidoreductase subunit ActD [Candidatus Deferrimicrobiaceae bacterium]